MTTIEHQERQPRIYIHTRFVRVFHLLNALGIMLMIMSGWRIYHASPLFHFSFP